MNISDFRYEDELAMSAIKREAVTLYEQLRVVEMKRNELLIEEQERGTPGQVIFNLGLTHSVINEIHFLIS